MRLRRTLWCAAVAAVFFSAFPVCSNQGARAQDDDALAEQARQALDKGIAFYHSIAIEGGYVYDYTLDLREKWGEGRTDDRTVEVQPPGTPAVGMSFLRAFAAAGNPAFLQAAEDAAGALILGQNDLGGWDHKIYFDRPKASSVSFDDDQTQSAIRFLMALDQKIDKAELTAAVDKALAMMLASQMDHGAWPHRYPVQHNYHDFATFNDGGINDCLSVMFDADRYYGRKELRDSIDKAGWFFILSQLPPPQPGWAQQYNQYLQPAWARAFEPPAVCPQVTIRNIHALIELYLYTGDGRYLEPIPDALRWLESSKMPNGRWARFVEIGTGKALYYDRGRIRVNSTEELSLERRTGYGYENNLDSSLQRAQQRFASVTELGREKYLEAQAPSHEKSDLANRLNAIKGNVRAVIESQDDQGRWIVKNDRYRKEVSGRQWNGEYETKDRISSALFNANVALLCEYLEVYQDLNRP